MLTLVSQPNDTFFISQLSLVEMQSGFAKKVRIGLIDELTLDELMGAFSFDIERKRFSVASVDDEVFGAAEQLMRTHAVKRALRTLDALQIAVAIALSRSGLAETLVASDDNLCAVAKVEGLAVINPLHD